MNATGSLASSRLAMTRPSSALRAPSPRKRGEGELLNLLPLAPRERGEGGPFGSAQGKLRPGEGSRRREPLSPPCRIRAVHQIVADPSHARAIRAVAGLLTRLRLDFVFVGSVAR